LKNTIVENCRKNSYQSFGEYKIQSIEDMDGWKYNITDDSWVMIRPSGTEPVLRIYVESPSEKESVAIIEATKKTILNSN